MINHAQFVKVVLCVLCFVSIPFFTIKAQEKYRTGCVLNKELYEQVPLAAPLMRGDYKNLPAKTSLRKYAPVPQNQGAYGTCVGWSTAYAARTILMAHQQNWTNSVLITENAFSPFFVYEQAKSISDVYCQEGTSLFNALEIIKEIGAVRISEFASQCGQTITNSHEQKARQFKIKDYKRLFDAESSDKILLVKKSLAENKPVIIGIQCCAESFLNAKGIDYWKLQDTDNSTPEGGHALTVIGYDDNKEGGAFELMNSWGTSWGDDGFIWMSYEDFDNYCFEAYEMTGVESDVHSLSGNLRFILSSNENMPVFYKGGYYEMKETYESGTLFRMYITNNEPAYVYSFTSDLSQENIKIFPQNSTTSAYLGYKGNNIAIPNEDYFMQLDTTEGVDYFCVLYSAEKLDIDRVLSDMQQASGSFYGRLHKVLADKMIEPEQVKYSIEEGVSFQASSKNKTIVPIIVAIQHNK